MRDSYTKYVMVGLLTLTFLLLFITHSMAEMPNHLTPCYNPIMGRGELNDYFHELHKRFFVEQHAESYECMLRMMTLPSFAPEKVIMVYKTYEGKIMVEYLAADGSIERVVQYRYYAEDVTVWRVFLSELRSHKNVRDAIDNTMTFLSRKPKPVTITSYRASISAHTAALLRKIWWRMIEETRVSQTGTVCLDGVMYLFSVNSGTCGMAHCPSEHSLPGALVEIGEQLQRLAIHGTESEAHEKTLYDLATQLLEELKAHNPEWEEKFVKYFGEGFCQ